jgi:antitoxin component YwqK of YwqJK toxin-antitoxin module
LDGGLEGINKPSILPTFQRKYIMFNKKTILLFLPGLLLLMAFNSTAQDSLKVKPNGYNKFYYRNGKLASEGSMRDGKPDGYWKNYYKTGGLKSEGNRKDYLLDSTWKFYDEKGKLTLKINYKNGKKNGYRYTYQGEEITKEFFVDDVKQNYAYVLFANGKIKMKIPFKDGLETGNAIEYDSSGNIIQLITYKKGYVVERERINRYDAKNMPHGKWKWFFEDEVLQSEGNFNHGLKNGYFKEYDRDGNLLSAKKFVNGEEIEKAEELVKLDVRRDYYPNGKPKVVATYNADGIPEGVRREYNPDGEVVKAYVFRKGKIVEEGIITDAGEKEGNWKEYYPNGELKAIGFYQNDEKLGEWKYYYPDGQLEQIGKFTDGQPDSVWNWYYQSGNLLREEHFFNGLPDGLLTEYSEDGKIITQGDYIEGKKEGIWIYSVGDNRDEIEYADGLRNGLFKSYYKDITVSYEGKFVDDLPNGEHKWYWVNGRIKKQGKYVMGRKTGDWRKYDSDGNLIITISYQNGKEIKYDGITVDIDN